MTHDGTNDPHTQGEQIRHGIKTALRSPVTLGEAIFSGSGGGPVDPNQFVDINLGGATRSPEAQAKLAQAVAEYDLGNFYDAGGRGTDRPTSTKWGTATAASDTQVPASNDVFEFGADPLPSMQSNFNLPVGVASPEYLAAQSGIPTDPFTPPGGGGDYGVAAAYENYFGNQEQYAQDKFDSISNYLDQLQLSSDEGFAADMQRIDAMYEGRRDARNQRFEEAMGRVGGRESAAIDTLAEIGIEADADTFDSVTGETKDMLFSQQMSGADMLNTMSYITETIYDFAKDEQDLAIAAGLENAQQNLLSEMAAIQMARDGKAISDAEAAQAAADAAEDAANMKAYWITMGQSLGMGPMLSVAAGETGMFGDFYDTATDLNRPTIETPYGLMTPEQYNAMRQTDLDQERFWWEMESAPPPIWMSVGEGESAQNYPFQPGMIDPAWVLAMNEVGMPLNPAIIPQEETEQTGE